ncbi:MAG: hypothetical protein ACXAEU_03570 [Candidatus Hodarchaeales archaeon]|jgi:hypothetical protein
MFLLSAILKTGYTNFKGNAMNLMKVTGMTTVILLTVLSVIAVQACTFTYGAPHLSSLRLTSNSDRLLTTVTSHLDPSNSTGACIDLDNESLSWPGPEDIEVRIPLSEKRDSPYGLTLEYRGIMTLWQVVVDNTLVVNVTVPVRENTKTWQFASQILKLAFLVHAEVDGTGNVIMVFLDNGTIKESTVYWDLFAEDYYRIYEEENLAVFYGGCCYCVGGIYYRMSREHGLEYITKSYYWTGWVIDPRIKRIIFLDKQKATLTMINYSLPGEITKTSMSFLQVDINWYLDNRNKNYKFTRVEHVVVMVVLSLMIVGIYRKKKDVC